MPRTEHALESVGGRTRAPVARIVRQVVESDWAMTDALQRDYANLSGVARAVRGSVEAAIGSTVSEASLLAAVKRLRSRLPRTPHGVMSVVAGSTVTVRTDVAKLAVERTKRAGEGVRALLVAYQQEFLQVSESSAAFTLIFDQRLGDEVVEHFRTSDILEKELNLAAIIVHSPEAIVHTPGCAITFLSQLSRRGINIQDIVSCYTDTIIVVRMADVGRAFEALTELIRSARALSPRRRVQTTQ